MKERKIMTTRRVEMERFSRVSLKPFQAVLAALKAAVWHPDWRSLPATKGARTFAELEDVVRRGLGKTELMLFMELDHGAILRKETGLDSPKIVRLVETQRRWLSLGTWIRKSSAFVESRRSDHTAVA